MKHREEAMQRTRQFESPASERCRWRGRVSRVARLAGFGAIADRHRGRGGAGRRATPGAGRVRVHGRAGRHAGWRALFLRYPSQSRLPPRYERRDQPRSRADQRRQRPRGNARGRFAGGGRRRQTDQQTQPRRHGHDRYRGHRGKAVAGAKRSHPRRQGRIYFTDPGPRPVVRGRIAYVYYLPVGAKQPIVIDDKIARPNGLTLTRDGKTLIVDDTLNPTVYAYDVEPDGSVKNKRTFAQLRDIPEGKESGADGMALDREDRVYITTLTGVQVFDAAGKYLGTIKVARQPANVGFAGPDKRVLFITAREGLYRLDTLAQGPDRVGK